MRDKDCLLLSICEIQSQYAVGAAMGASPPCGGEFGLGFDLGKVGWSEPRAVPDRSQAITNWCWGQLCAKREAEAALMRVGHPIKLLFATPNYLP